jgi:hypothetical protein
LKKSTVDDDTVPTSGLHRGVPLHSGQSERRLAIVRKDIDAAHALDGVGDLMIWLRNTLKAPESRLLAAAKLKASYESAAHHREVRPAIDLELVVALAAPIESRKWRSPVNYGSDLCLGPAVPRDPDDAPIDE